MPCCLLRQPNLSRQTHTRCYAVIPLCSNSVATSINQIQHVNFCTATLQNREVINEKSVKRGVKVYRAYYWVGIATGHGRNKWEGV